jgi:hypothetical protein
MRNKIIGCFLVLAVTGIVFYFYSWEKAIDDASPNGKDITEITAKDTAAYRFVVLAQIPPAMISSDSSVVPIIYTNHMPLKLNDTVALGSISEHIGGTGDVPYSSWEIMNLPKDTINSRNDFVLTTGIIVSIKKFRKDN